MERICKVWSRSLPGYSVVWPFPDAYTPWGASGAEIARAAEDPDKYNLIMNVVSERLQMRDENWRLCYKALLLLEFLVKHGPWVGGTGPKPLPYVLVRSDPEHHAGCCIPRTR